MEFYYVIQEYGYCFIPKDEYTDTLKKICPKISFQVQQTGYFLPYPYAFGKPGSMHVKPAGKDPIFIREELEKIPPQEPPKVAEEEEAACDQDEENTDQPLRDSVEVVISVFHPKPEGTESVLVRAGLEYFYDLEGVHRPNFNLQINGALARFGVETEFASYLEPLSDGTIGDTYFTQAKVDVGLSLKGWEPYIGFEFIRVSPVNFYGPVAGLKKWF